jgi:hypothetical protein
MTTASPRMLWSCHLHVNPHHTLIMSPERNADADKTPAEERQGFGRKDSHDFVRLDHVASARRYVNLCLFAWLASMAFQIHETRIASLVVIVLTIATVVGVFRLTVDLENLPPWRAAFVVMAVLPVVSLLVMAVLSGRATKELGAAGYRVGMLDAERSRVV